MQKNEIERSIKLRLFTSRNQVYMQILLAMRDSVAWFFKHEQQFLTVPFILTCAAALECTLNDALIRSLTTPEEEALVDGYLSMSLRGKLSNVVPIVTHNKFRIDRSHQTYKALSELISLRNRLVHNKSGFENHDGTVVTEPAGQVHIRVADGLAERVDDVTFGLADTAGRLHDALEDFHEKFFNTYDQKDFKGNELVVAVRKRHPEPSAKVSFARKHV